MILKFRHKGLKKLFEKGNPGGVSAQHARKISQILAVLNICSKPEEMELPGFHLHQLKGDRNEQWAVSVSGNWRIVFGFLDENITNVDLIDYH